MNHAQHWPWTQHSTTKGKTMQKIQMSVQSYIKGVETGDALVSTFDAPMDAQAWAAQAAESMGWDMPTTHSIAVSTGDNTLEVTYTDI